jgi:N6-L-threonylcarbamoyladenine synthase
MILGIESSCDESALAVFDADDGFCGEWVHSQMDLHREYGGVVPELASREHLEKFPMLLKKVLTCVRPEELREIAVTSGPGLAPCLALGISLARSLGIAWNIPVRGINHLRSHAFSVFIGLHDDNPVQFRERLAGHLPHLGLLVSGGNTLLFEIREDLAIHLIAQTVDDAAGEALDKGAKLLGLDYPGGALLEKHAIDGDPAWREFPRAFARKPEMRFSFSGLKTSLRYLLEKMSDVEVEDHFHDLCASYQAAVMDQLVAKSRQALETRSFCSLGLSGGVANNRILRNRFKDLAQRESVPLFLAEPRHSGDNAGMIAFAAYMESHPESTHEEEDRVILQPSLKINEAT